MRTPFAEDRVRIRFIAGVKNKANDLIWLYTRASLPLLCRMIKTIFFFSFYAQDVRVYV